MSDPLSAATWRVVAGNFAEALYLLRLEAPCGTLEACPWDILRVVLAHQTRGTSSPTQAELASHTGYSVRSVRRGLAALRGTGLVHVTGGGGVALEFALGPWLVAFLRDFAHVRDPKVWRWTRPAPPNVSETPLTLATVAGVSADTKVTTTGVAAAPATVAGVTLRTETEARGAGSPSFLAIRALDGATPVATPDVVAGVSDVEALSLIKNKEDLNSSFSKERGPTPATMAGDAPVDATRARRLALDALAVWFRRRYEGMPLPATCNAAHVRIVEACAADGTWTVDTLRQAHLDAIAGAFDRAPADRPPTPRYIWGELHFFLAHVAAGRAIRLRGTAPPPKSKKPPPPEDEPASFAWLAEHLREVNARFARSAE